MSTALEKYLVSIGHNGKYNNDTHRCTCSGNSAPSPSVRTSSSTRTGTRTATPVVINGGRTPVVLEESPFYTLANAPVVKTQVDTTTIKRSPASVGHGGGRPFFSGQSGDPVLNPYAVQNGNGMTPVIDQDAPDAFNDLLNQTLDNTGILPADVYPDVMNPSIDNTGIFPPVLVTPNPASQTGTIQTLPIASVDRSKKAGTWFLGLLVAGIVARKVFKGNSKKS